MRQKQNRNLETIMNWHYTQQQKAIKEICEELGLILYRPDYHALDRDCNTIMIYTKEAHEYNKELEKKWAKYGAHPFNEEYKRYICCLENTDANHHFSYEFMNGGRIDVRGLHYKEKIKEFIIKQYEKSEKEV